MRIAGVDEVGRGPLAGPVVAAAVVFEEGYVNENFKDSKKLSPKKRENLIEEIKTEALDWAIVAVGPRRIEKINIREASKLAMSIASNCTVAELVLVDGNMEIDTGTDQVTVIKGDSLHVEISAASILAKVWRDNRMKELDQLFPGYDLGKHAGYPTKAHKEAVRILGPSPIHRRTFRGVKEYLSGGFPLQKCSIEADEEEILVIKKRSEETLPQEEHRSLGGTGSLQLS